MTEETRTLADLKDALDGEASPEVVNPSAETTAALPEPKSTSLDAVMEQVAESRP